MEGLDLNDHDALVSLAASVGFDWGQVSVYLGSATDVETVRRLELEARGAGIDIVPFFIFNGKVTVSGAHDVQVLLEAMARATTTAVASLVERSRGLAARRDTQARFARARFRAAWSSTTPPTSRRRSEASRR